MKQSKRQDYLVSRIQNFTKTVIETKRKEFESKEEVNHNEVEKDDEEFGVKKRLALLDLLLNAKQEGQALTDDDIQEEVNNFMFAVRISPSKTLNIYNNQFLTGTRYNYLFNRVLTL